MRQTPADMRKLFITFPILATVHREQPDYQQAIRALCERAISERNRDLHAHLLPLIAGPEQDYYSAILRFGCLPAELDQLDVRAALRPRFTLARGITRWKQGDMDGARGLIKEASALATKMNDAFVFVDASIARAILLGNEGRHNTALELIEAALPIGQQLAPAYPVVLPHLYNNASVELLAIGRPQEAGKYATLAFMSPLRPRFSEWTQTATEIAEHSQLPKRLYMSVHAPSSPPELAEPVQAEVCEIEPPGAKAGVFLSIARYKLLKKANSGRVTMNKPTDHANETPARRRNQEQIDSLALALHDKINDLVYERNPIPVFRAATEVLNVLDMTEQESEEIITCVNGLRKSKIINKLGE